MKHEATLKAGLMFVQKRLKLSVLSSVHDHLLAALPDCPVAFAGFP